MNGPEQAIMSDTFFTASPDWTWWIIFYFFVGGIAGTAFLLASILDLTGPGTRGTRGGGRHRSAQPREALLARR